MDFGVGKPVPRQIHSDLRGQEEASWRSLTMALGLRLGQAERGVCEASEAAGNVWVRREDREKPWWRPDSLGQGLRCPQKAVVLPLGFQPGVAS